jgi:hypothetical protein
LGLSDAHENRQASEQAVLDEYVKRHPELDKSFLIPTFEPEHRTGSDASGSFPSAMARFVGDLQQPREPETRGFCLA